MNSPSISGPDVHDSVSRALKVVAEKHEIGASADPKRRLAFDVVEHSEDSASNADSHDGEDDENASMQANSLRRPPRSNLLKSDKLCRTSSLGASEFSTNANRHRGTSSVKFCAKGFEASLFSAQRKAESTIPTTDRVTKTNLRRLKDDVNQKYEGLASKIVELSEQGVLKAKEKNLRRMIHTLSSFVFALALVGILYGNFLMLAPHLNAVSMAVLLSLTLSPVISSCSAILESWKIYIESFLEKSTVKWSSVLFPILFTFAAMETCKGMDSVVHGHFAIVFWIQVCFVGSICCILFIGSRSLAAGVLTLFVLGALCVPLLFAVKKCAAEAEFVTSYLLKLIDDDKALLDLLNSVLNSNVFASLQELFPSKPDQSILKEDLKETVREAADFAGQSLKNVSGDILGVVTNLSNLLWALTTFSTTLFYLLSNESPWEFFNSLSPLSPQDNEELYESLTKSTTRIILCSTCIGSLHGTAMYVVLSLASFELVAIPAFLCAIFAIMPVFGTYVVYFPIALVLWAREARLSAIALCLVDSALILLVDGKITAYIPGNPHFVGLSIVAGLYSFGALGFLYGPLLVGLTSSTINIYLKYLKRPLNQDMYSPNPRRKLFST